MKKEDIQELLLAVIKDYYETQTINIEVTKDTPLFGGNSELDSIGLVNVIIDTESRFLDNDIEISLTSESAMSRSKSPFRTIETLAEFIFEQVGDNNE